LRSFGKSCKVAYSGLWLTPSWPTLFLTTVGTTEVFIDLISKRRLRPTSLRLRPTIQPASREACVALNELDSLRSLRVDKLRPGAFRALQKKPLAELELMILRRDEMEVSSSIRPYRLKCFAEWLCLLLL
jgi:hypothetical protein